MTMKEVEAITGISGKNIRFYESKGLLTPTRNIDNDYRSFTQEDIQVLQMIKSLRKLNLSIDNIALILDDRKAFVDIIVKHIQELESQIAHFSTIKNLCKQINSDAQLYMSLSKMVLEFEDLLIAQPQVLEQVLQEVGRNDVMVACAGASPSVVELLCGIQQLDANEIHKNIGPVCIEDVELCQYKIIRLYNQKLSRLALHDN